MPFNYSNHQGYGYLLNPDVADELIDRMEHMRRTMHFWANIPDAAAVCTGTHNKVVYVTYTNGGYASGDVLNDFSEADGGSSYYVLGGTGAAGDPVVGGTSATILNPSPIIFYPRAPLGCTVTGFDSSDFAYGSSKVVMLVNGFVVPSATTTYDDLGNLTLAHEDSRSVAANRITCPGDRDYILQPGDAAILRFDTDTSRWTLSP